MKKSKGTTQIGFVNRNGQVVIRNTGDPGTGVDVTVISLWEKKNDADTHNSNTHPSSVCLRLRPAFDKILRMLRLSPSLGPIWVW